MSASINRPTLSAALLWQSAKTKSFKHGWFTLAKSKPCLVILHHISGTANDLVHMIISFYTKLVLADVHGLFIIFSQPFYSYFLSRKRGYNNNKYSIRSVTYVLWEQESNKRLMETCDFSPTLVITPRAVCNIIELVSSVTSIVVSLLFAVHIAV